MKKKYGTLLKNIGLFTIGSFGSKMISFLMLPLYTALLTTSDYGTVELLQSTAQLLMPILLLSIQDAMLRFGMDSKYKNEDVLSTSINIIIKGSILLIIGIVIIIVTDFIKMSVAYWFFLFLTFLIGALNNCLNIYLKVKNKATVIAIGGIICTIITCSSNVVLLLFVKAGILGYMISSIVGIAVQITYQIIFGRIYKDFHIMKYENLSKPMVKYSFPLIGNSIAWWINNASDRYILTWISGTAINGIYAVAYKIPSILTTFQNIFYNAWSISAISEFDKNDEDSFIGNNYTLYSFISMLICSIILLFNIQISKLLYTGEYFSAWKCVPFLLIAFLFNGIAQFEGSLFAATKKTKEVFYTTLIGAILNIIGNFIFIFKFGAVGAALSTMIGYGVTWILRTIFLQKFIKMNVNWKAHLLCIALIIIQGIVAVINSYYIVQITILAIILLFHYKYIYIILEKLFYKILKIKDV